MSLLDSLSAGIQRNLTSGRKIGMNGYGRKLMMVTVSVIENVRKTEMVIESVIVKGTVNETGIVETVNEGLEKETVEVGNEIVIMSVNGRGKERESMLVALVHGSETGKGKLMRCKTIIWADRLLTG